MLPLLVDRALFERIFPLHLASRFLAPIPNHVGSVAASALHVVFIVLSRLESPHLAFLLKGRRSSRPPVRSRGWAHLHHHHHHTQPRWPLVGPSQKTTPTTKRTPHTRPLAPRTRSRALPLCHCKQASNHHSRTHTLHGDS